MTSNTNETSFPRSLTWIERGSVLVRRMNSERIAEDPRLRKLLYPNHMKTTITTEYQAEMMNNTINNENKKQKQETDMKDMETTTEVFDSNNGDIEDYECIQTDNIPESLKQQPIIHSSRVFQWTSRLSSSIQSSLQYALFPKASEDGYFVPISPSIYCIAPSFINIFRRLFDPYVSQRHWNAAYKVMNQLDAIISKRFQSGACIFDCGLFDGIKRLHDKKLASDEFCDGQIASMKYCRGAIPSMHSTFVLASTVSAWLDLRPESNVAVILAPNNAQMSVFATACALYCTDATTFPSQVGVDMLNAYQQTVKWSESLVYRLHRSFVTTESRNTMYVPNKPSRIEARFIEDFCTLLESRDLLIQRWRELGEMHENRKLTGITVTPARRDIYVHDVILLVLPDDVKNDDEEKPPVSDSGRSSQIFSSDVPAKYRPYFVLQNEKGVLYSSMVRGVQSVDLHELAQQSTSEKGFSIKVRKTLKSIDDLVLKMYDLPFGRQGEILFECRMNASILLDCCTNESTYSERSTIVQGVTDGQIDDEEEKSSQVVVDMTRHYTMQDDATQDRHEVTFFLDNGDFDCISVSKNLPSRLAFKLIYSADSSSFPEEIEPPRDLGIDLSSPRITRNGRSDFNTLQVKPQEAYSGPSVVSIEHHEPNIRTAFGDGTLERVDIIRREVTQNGYRLSHSPQLEFYILFQVHLSSSSHLSSPVVKILPYSHLFRYSLPSVIQDTLRGMGCPDELIITNRWTSSSFESAAEMSFDEEYARWLQQMYESEMDINESVADTLDPNTPISSEYRIANLEIPRSSGILSIRQLALSQNERPGVSRGASVSQLQQLPTYIYSESSTHQKEKLHRTESGLTDCMICRCLFTTGEEIKILPCFHSYHSECIDNWLALNKVCPVCQCSVDECDEM